MSPKNELRLGIIFIVVAVIAILTAFYFYSKQLEACDKSGGVLVKGGLSNVCVKELK